MNKLDLFQSFVAASPYKHHHSPSQTELVIVEIFNPQSLFLCLTYFPPDVSQSSVATTLSHIESTVADHLCILLGDFNMPDIEWSSPSCSNHRSKSLCVFVFNNNFIQYIQSPKHVKGNILDLIFANSSEIIQEVCVLSNEPFPQMRSDHRMISFRIPCLSKTSKTSNSTSFNFLRVTTLA